MYVRAASASPVGLAALPIDVEVHRGAGLPGVTLVGLARGAAREALVRVRAALGRLGVHLGSLRLTVSLLPAELPKAGSALDLALAAALLGATHKVCATRLAGCRFYGELSLDGGVQAVTGGVFVADLAQQCGDKALYVAPQNVAEAQLVPGVQVVGVDSLEALLCHLRGDPLPAAASPLPVPVPLLSAAANDDAPCLSDVVGQQAAKQAMVVAAAGGHNALLVGPPGSGKSMLAKTLPGLLPPLSAAEQQAVLRVRAATGALGQGLCSASTALGRPPFRAPHHSATVAAMMGGGSEPMPGEVTLAHAGVLLLDELPEFSRKAIEALRGPLEDGEVRVARVYGRVAWPARCLLVATMNPCPCGYWRPGGGDPAQQVAASATVRLCLCAFAALERYRAKLSGPLLDRMDVRIFVDEVPLAALGPRSDAGARRAAAGSSAHARAQVEAARERQTNRQGALQNAALSAAQLDEVVPLTAPLLARLQQAQQQHALSLRGVARVRKVARTLADLRGSPSVCVSDVDRALALRGPF